MIWPERADSWQYGAYAARKAFLRVIETISESESMTVLCSEGQYDNARAQLPDRVRLVVMETDDAWARDVGPTFVINGRGERRGIDWGFNAWGGDVDACIPRGRKTTAWRASSATWSATTYTINAISFARRLHPLGRRGHRARHRSLPAERGTQSRSHKGRN